MSKIKVNTRHPTTIAFMSLDNTWQVGIETEKHWFVYKLT
jgi:hypothetical protein